jgi:hypothetical protein
MISRRFSVRGGDARAALIPADLRAGANPTETGDYIDLPPAAKEAERARIDAAFGRGFADALAGLTT